ncbi:hypothetical protein K523DRAFT_422255 [Schizophyllum commune Tattone D]|nr:hypothetical protein K523DRAFT_422255 [Schizophyllum commune Tattone D]
MTTDDVDDDDRCRQQHCRLPASLTMTTVAVVDSMSNNSANIPSSERTFRSTAVSSSILHDGLSLPSVRADIRPPLIIITNDSLSEQQPPVILPPIAPLPTTHWPSSDRQPRIILLLPTLITPSLTSRPLSAKTIARDPCFGSHHLPDMAGLVTARASGCNCGGPKRVEVLAYTRIESFA